MEKLFDDELAGMVNFTDETAPAEMPVMEQKKPTKAKEPAPAVSVAEFKPVPNAQRGLMDRLLDCAIWLGITGCIAMLMWWFWVNDLMAMEAAYPCILACGVIGAFGAGMNFRK